MLKERPDYSRISTQCAPFPTCKVLINPKRTSDIKVNRFRELIFDRRVATVVPGKTSSLRIQIGFVPTAASADRELAPLKPSREQNIINRTVFAL